ncbi:TPA: hypothetical protein PFD71_003196 [Vibrio cholerae]|uniref:hypothetical protein n=1 Tax=Vibrio cholerae TaxID=666 RepID=UPI00205D52BD|nr:hypothetical protein 1992IndM4_0870 [Vibrio phage ICP1]HDG1611306.1 hypothetical protein [Vibrio cholerae]
MSLQTIGNELSTSADENPHQVVEFLVEWLTGDKYWTNANIRHSQIKDLISLVDYYKENNITKLMNNDY